jgi:hypothetical protein
MSAAAEAAHCVFRKLRNDLRRALRTQITIETLDGGAPKKGLFTYGTRGGIHTALRLRFKAEKWRPALIRTVLSDAQWQRIAPELPGKIGDPHQQGEHDVEVRDGGQLGLALRHPRQRLRPAALWVCGGRPSGGERGR